MLYRELITHAYVQVGIRHILLPVLLRYVWLYCRLLMGSMHTFTIQANVRAEATCLFVKLHAMLGAYSIQVQQHENSTFLLPPS